MWSAHSYVDTDSVKKAVRHLRTIGINFVALDFDKTILSIHTGGVWTGSVEELQEHIRPEIRQFMWEIAKDPTNKSIHMAIVTFSGQIQLVHGVLNAIIKDPHYKIPVRGSDGSWREPSQTRNWWPENADINYDSGKQAHMLSAIHELERTKHATISKSSTILVDDDGFNVEVAQSNGVRGVVLDSKNPRGLFADILRLT